MADPVERVRASCLALPEVEERLSHEHPSWFVGGKRMFATFTEGRSGDRPSMGCAAPLGAQEDYTTGRPDAYFRPPYVGHRGPLGMYMDDAVDLSAIRHHVREAYRVVAPRRLIVSLDEN